MINTLKKLNLKPSKKAIENVQQTQIGLTVEKIQLVYFVEGLSYRDVMNSKQTNNGTNSINEKPNHSKIYNVNNIVIDPGMVLIFCR
jgi:hypothetical protein